MFPLIINVARVPIPVNSSACGVPAVFWAPSHGKRCPVSSMKEDARNKESGQVLSVLVYFRAGSWVGDCM